MVRGKWNMSIGYGQGVFMVTSGMR